MNWFKKSFKLETFEDRNRLNARIQEFKRFVAQLRYISEYVFQNAPHAKEVIKSIMDSKSMTSYPKIQERLKGAYDKALDHYPTCAKLCIDAMDTIFSEIDEMKQERKEFSEKTIPERHRERNKNDSGTEKE